MNAYCINLDSRPDRWAQFIAQPWPFPVQRVSGIANPEGWRGLLQTLHGIFAATTGDVLVLEDDALIVRPFHNFDQALRDVRATGFDTLYLGCNLKGTARPHRDHTRRISGAWTTHAVVYSNAMRLHLLEAIPTMSAPIDEYLRTQVHPKGRSFCIRPMVCYQRPSHSDIEGGHRDYLDLFRDSDQRLR